MTASIERMVSSGFLRNVSVVVFSTMHEEKNGSVC